LEQKFLYDESVAIACVYFNHKENFAPVDILGSLIKHLVQRRARVSDEIRDLYNRHLQRETRPTFTELSEQLQTESRKFSTVFIVLDALDECPESQQTRAKVLSILRELQTMRLMVTGRPHILDMTQTFEGAVRLDICASDSDIEKYVEGQMEMQTNLKKYKQGDDLRETIKNTIVSKANGM